MTKWHGGKGSGRRSEDKKKIDANWDAIFHPQANCCSGGMNMDFNAKKLCQEYTQKLFTNGHVW